MRQGTAAGADLGRRERARRRARRSSRDFGITATADNAAAVADADLVVLAVKPQDAGAVLAPLHRAAAQRARSSLSVAAGIRVAALESWCGPGVPVVRAMPNRPALVGAGVTGLFAPAHVDAAQRAAARNRSCSPSAKSCGLPTEDALDVVTALSGSGPAYFFLLAELMAEAGVGTRPRAATRAAPRRSRRSTARDCSRTRSDGDLARLRAEVTSKGGTTEAALRMLQAADLRGIIAPRARGGDTPRAASSPRSSESTDADRIDG